MDYSWWSAKLIESANFFGFFAGVWFWVKGFSWKQGASESAHQVVAGLQWMAAGLAGNCGWFALSRHLRDTGGPAWNAGMYEYRVIAVTTTIAAFVYGASKLAKTIDAPAPCIHERALIAIGFIALAFGFL